MATTCSDHEIYIYMLTRETSGRICRSTGIDHFISGFIGCRSSAECRQQLENDGNVPAMQCILAGLGLEIETSPNNI